MDLNVILYIFASLMFKVSSLSPTTNKVQDRDYESFNLMCDTMIGDKIKVQKYKSPRTGLTVTIANSEGPLVSGYIALATEARSDDGLPHTLEHLVFMGSERYPYKGVLDRMANRFLASGTNAWTATDHTAYTIQTAGSEGFLKFLPIYMDHLLYPTLTESSFVTEVYHINGKGEDSGVVYSEMQSRENGAGDRAWTAFTREMYPFPSGYRFRTGGRLDNLRNSTNIEKIRKYHEAFYRPENMNVIIVGQVEPEEVFKALSITEETIVNKEPKEPFTRPWQAQVPQLNRSVDKEVEYSSDKEKHGSVLIGWRGPCPITNKAEYQGLRILTSFLTYSSISPLNKIFVENDDAVALSASGWIDFYSTTNFGFSFSGVKVDNMTMIKPMLYRTLYDISSGREPIDMKVMMTFLDNLSAREASSLEGNAKGVVSDAVIKNTLYGNTCSDLNKHLNRNKFYEYLRKQSPNYWKSLIREYMLSSPSITIRVKPSIKMSEKVQEEKMQREKKRKDELKEEDFQKLKDELKEAKKNNEVPPPPEMINVTIPGTDKIMYHYMKTFTNINPKQAPDGVNTFSPHFFNLSDIPIKTIVTDMHTEFVEIMALMDTSKLNVNQRQYLPLLLELLFESSVKMEDKIVNYEDVIKLRDFDLLSSGAALSLGSFGYFTCGGFCHMARIRIEVDMKRYEKGVQWLKYILFNVQLHKERIKVKAKNSLNSISDYKISASSITSIIYNDITFKNDTNRNQINALRMEGFLKNVLKRLETEPESVIQEMEKIMKEITKLDNMIMAIGSNFEKLSKMTDISKPWKSFVSNDQKSTNYNLVAIPSYKERSFEDLDNITGYVYGLKSLETGNLRQFAPSLSDNMHPDVPALRVAIKYLTQSEGPLWREIRGKGLSYSYQMFLSTSHGNIFFTLARASQLLEAYQVGLNIIESYINGTRKFENSLLESATSSLIYGAISGEAQIYNKFWQSVSSYFNKTPLNITKIAVENYSKVTISDLERVSKLYFTPLLNSTNSKIIIICNPSKIEETIVTLKERYNHNLHKLDKIDDSRFSN